MKKLTYKIRGYTDVWNPETNEVEQRECLAVVDAPYSEANEEKAKREAYNGECEIVDGVDIAELR